MSQQKSRLIRPVCREHFSNFVAYLMKHCT